MLRLFLLPVLLLTSLVVAHTATAQTATAPFVNPMFFDRPEDNPQIDIVLPRAGGFYWGFFAVEIKNFDYIPELATNPVQAFATGADAAGDPLVFAEGHLHGWVFEVDRWGNILREPSTGKPTPASYVRFYGAGGAEYFGDRTRAFYVKTDDLPRGRYKVFFQLQQNDHTGALQASAPAFPGIASVTFRVLW